MYCAGGREPCWPLDAHSSGHNKTTGFAWFRVDGRALKGWAVARGPTRSLSQLASVEVEELAWMAALGPISLCHHNCLCRADTHVLERKRRFGRSSQWVLEQTGVLIPSDPIHVLCKTRSKKRLPGLQQFACVNSGPKVWRS